MVGSFARNETGMRLEWNALNDPHAAAVVYNARPPIHRSIGLDVTVQVRMHADEVRRRFQTPRLRPVLDMAEVWFRERPEIVFHDPLAAATIFDEEICAYERGVVEVELVSARLAGLTHFSPAPDGPHEVATTVDAERFFREYFAVTAS